MTYTIQSTHSGCTLSGKSLHSVWSLSIPIGAGDLTALLSTLLADPDKRQVESGPVVIERTPAGVTFRTNEGSFDLPWPHLFAIEGAPHV